MLFFSANQKLSIYRKLYALLSKASRFRNQNTSRSNNFLLSSKTALFYVQKAFLLHKPFLAGFKNRPFSQTKRFSFAQTFFTATQSSLFCPPPPLPTALNLLFAKNTVVLLLFALILCCKARTSHRFKSLPAIPGKIPFSALPVTL